jgi:hypothetical protein
MKKVHNNFEQGQNEQKGFSISQATLYASSSDLFS